MTKSKAVATSEFPDHVRVGPHIYTIELAHTWPNQVEDEEEIGHTEHKTSHMYIGAFLSTSMRQSVLLHELLHCAAFMSGQWDKIPWSQSKRKAATFDWEEYFISALDQPLLAILRDNPHIVDYLLSQED